ncbi:MAG: hypothetical protein WA821_09575 [Anaerolineales bacterium]
MKKYYVQNALKFLLLMGIALSSGCAQSTVIVSPTATFQPTLAPTSTQISRLTNTPELIQPKGILIYSDSEAVYSLDLRSKKATPIINTGKKSYPYAVVDTNSIYILKQVQNAGSETISTHQLLKMNFDGTQSEQLTFDEDTNSDKFDLSSAPKGDKLAYIKKVNTTYSLVIFDKNKKSTKVVTDKNGFDYFAPSWSPDGKKLVFFKAAVSERNTQYVVGFGNLLLYSIDDEKITELLPGEIVPIIKPAWSPDGKTIVLSRSNGTDYAGVDMWNLNIESNVTEKIVNGRYMIGASEFDYFDWSPNRNLVLYAQNWDEIYLLDLNSKKATKVYKGSQRFAGHNGLWSPDGKLIAYVTSSGKPPLPNLSVLNIQNTNGESIQFGIPANGWIDIISWIYP